MGRGSTPMLGSKAKLSLSTRPPCLNPRQSATPGPTVRAATFTTARAFRPRRSAAIHSTDSVNVCSSTSLMSHLIRGLFLVSFPSALLGQVLADTPAPRYEATWSSLDRRPTPEWFLDAKFGVFIHWGVYSVPAWGKHGEYAEWYWHHVRSDDLKDAVWRDFYARNYGATFDYMDFAPRFTAELFDAKQWADVFARAGVKYVVPTSKHHEGFALWPSAEATRT